MTQEAGQGGEQREDASAQFDARAFISTLTSKPGVYRMLDGEGQILYVGKARNLKKRVASYFLRASGSVKTEAMVSQIAAIEVTLTRTEDEALLLESNLIKRHRPKYNVTLRDDKSYPWIRITGGHEFPRLTFHRGARKPPHRYFGPYPSAGAVRHSLNSLHKLFQLRQCEDSFFAHRSRPCLQHQIKRCTAPCVGRISVEDYAQDVENAVAVLEGRGEAAIQALSRRMEQAAADLNFEQAAALRDRIGTLRRIHDQRQASGVQQDTDVVVTDTRGGIVAVAVLSIRNGENLGHEAFFPQAPESAGPEEILSAFLSQYYLDRKPPAEIIASAAPEEQDWLERGLSERGERKVTIKHRVRGNRKVWLDQTAASLQQALETRLASRLNVEARVAALQAALKLPEPPMDMECFDISHTQGEGTVASCVVFRRGEADKSAYRRFNIEGIEPGDDYAAMRQALERRYRRLSEEGRFPDLLVIDGGKGQLKQAIDILAEYSIPELSIVAIAKGPERRAGMEQLFMPGRAQPIRLPDNSAALHLLQEIRDEAHRFAISGHRGRRKKARQGSELDHIPGLGPKRRKALLQAFGGSREVARAGIEELTGVAGVSRALAQKIYDHYHT